MSTAERKLIVLPEDGITPIAEAIVSAQGSLDVKMFLFTEPTLINAVIAAHRRGIKTRIMLNPARRNGEPENAETIRLLTAAGIEVRETHLKFPVSHEKSMVVDGRLAFIKSMNWAAKNFTESRDYAVVTADSEEVGEVIDCFNADWERSEFNGGASARLVWCPGNGRVRIAQLIDKAKHYLYLQNERYQDMTIIEHLVRANRRGVRVRVLSLAPHSLKERKLFEGVNGLRLMDDVGIKVHKLKGLRLHAKMVLADGKRAIIGSMNIAPGSFDERRELGIEVTDESIVKTLESTFDHDWKNSRQLDLSDEGILKEMLEHGYLNLGSLALDSGERLH
jgi:phosphatidylserine/phosphatidylglycerophosphate/cardiolipin synthase-like enzyme